MIKAAGRDGNGRPLLVLGITAENVAKLKQGDPILIRSEQMGRLGLPELSLVICYGDTEGNIIAELEAQGLTDEDTEKRIEVQG